MFFSKPITIVRNTLTLANVSSNTRRRITNRNANHERSRTSRRKRETLPPVVRAQPDSLSQNCVLIVALCDTKRTPQTASKSEFQRKSYVKNGETATRRSPLRKVVRKSPPLLSLGAATLSSSPHSLNFATKARVCTNERVLGVLGLSCGPFSRWAHSYTSIFQTPLPDLMKHHIIFFLI